MVKKESINNKKKITNLKAKKLVSGLGQFQLQVAVLLS